MELLYNPKDPFSIFRHSERLMGRTLAQSAKELDPDLDEALLQLHGKGQLGNLVEKFFFCYEPNSRSEADFPEAGVELKVTPLKRTKAGELAIKERLSLGMIDFMTLVEEEFEDSHLLKKSILMLILFHLYIKGINAKDLPFIYSVLWKIKDKDYQIIKNDFLTIRDKVRNGLAHELSDGDTLYLAASRKGTSGQKLRRQPFSDVPVKARAFSFKTTYMRTILKFAQDSPKGITTNLEERELPGISLFSTQELKEKTFEELVVDRIMQFKGMSAKEILVSLGKTDSFSGKAINYLALCAIFDVKDLKKAEEIEKSGIVIKTIRIQRNGNIRESMSFENINYQEVYETSDWVNSSWYDIATSRFLFVTFRESETDDNKYLLDRAFFWTMPPRDLKVAEKYWKNIRANVLADTLDDKGEANGNTYWTLADDKYFHVRPKAGTSKDKHLSPVSGREVPRKAYWFNQSYILKIIREAYGNNQGSLIHDK